MHTNEFGTFTRKRRRRYERAVARKRFQEVAKQYCWVFRPTTFDIMNPIYYAGAVTL